MRQNLTQRRAAAFARLGKRIRELEAALAEAQAVIAKLPHTKDGVPITVGMDVWGEWQDVGIVEQIHSNHVVMRQPGGLFWRLGSECYSTKAAEAACGEEVRR